MNVPESLLTAFQANRASLRDSGALQRVLQHIAAWLDDNSDAANQRDHVLRAAAQLLANASAQDCEENQNVIWQHCFPTIFAYVLFVSSKLQCEFIQLAAVNSCHKPIRV